MQSLWRSQMHWLGGWQKIFAGFELQNLDPICSNRCGMCRAITGECEAHLSVLDLSANNWFQDSRDPRLDPNCRVIIFSMIWIVVSNRTINLITCYFYEFLERLCWHKMYLICNCFAINRKPIHFSAILIVNSFIHKRTEKCMHLMDNMVRSDIRITLIYFIRE